MIKSLFESEENQPQKIKVETEEKTAGDSAVEVNFESYFSGIESPSSEASDSKNFSEISKAADDKLTFSEKPEENMLTQSPAETTGETFNFSEPHFNQPQKASAETANYELFAENANERTNNEPLTGFPSDEIDFDLPDEITIEKSDFKSATEISNETAKPKSSFETVNATANFELPAQAKAEDSKSENTDLLFQSSAEPESFAETARQSGLAYAAAITLFGSVVFMLIIGWFADLLLGSSPWGIIGGIVLGAAIGFFQFFRLTSQIFKNKE